jgi:hypothetical protein
MSGVSGTLSPLISGRWDADCVPGVDTIEALTAAVQDFDAARLGCKSTRTPMPPSGSLCCGPAWCCWATVKPPDEGGPGLTEQTIRSREAASTPFLLDEVQLHGIAQTPVLVEELIAWVTHLAMSKELGRGFPSPVTSLRVSRSRFEEPVRRVGRRQPASLRPIMSRCQVGQYHRDRACVDVGARSADWDFLGRLLHDRAGEHCGSRRGQPRADVR